MAHRYSFNSALFADKLSAWIGGRTLRALAEDVGVSHIDLFHYRSQKRTPTVEKLATLCAAMGETMDSFVFDSEGEIEGLGG